MRQITEIAAAAGVAGQYLEQYGPYKAKVDYRLLKELAGKLSKGFPHLRVDFYEADGKLYVGELTLSHFSGIVPFEPESWDYTFGEWIELPKASS